MSRAMANRLAAAALVLGVAALPSTVRGSGFQLMEQNASGLGNAYAGQAAAVKNASAIFYNPAALVRVNGWNIVASVEPIDVSTTFSDAASTPPSVQFPSGPFVFPVATGTTGGNAGKWIPVPSGYVSGQLGERVWVGASVNVPFGLETSWESGWLGRFRATKSKVQTININPTLALKVNDVLSLGVGADYQHLKADLNQVVAYGSLAYAGTAQAVAGFPAPVQQALVGAVVAQLGGPAGLALEGPALMTGTSDAWGWNAGVLLKLGEQAHVGASYRSKVKHDVEGTITFSGAPTLLESGPTGAIGTALNARFKQGPVTTTIELPDSFSAAAAWENETYELMADWSWTHWTTIPALTIYRQGASDPISNVPLTFQDTWRIGLGGSAKLNENWRLRLGTAYDKSPVQDLYRTPRLPDNSRVWAAGGLQWRLSDTFQVDAGYAHLFLKDASSDLPNQDSSTATPVGALIGEYKAHVDIVGVQLSLHF
jgi:long-chain fatty acid transport protein